MKTSLLIIGPTLLLVTPASPQATRLPDRAWTPRSPMAVAARERFTDSVKAAEKKLQDDLEHALQEATRANDIEEAIRIRDLLRLVRRQPPEDAIGFRGHYYKLFNEEVTWHVAKKRCEEMGGYLVCVSDEREEQFLRHLLGDQAVWLGATDEENEGKWQWVSGEPFRYSDWRVPNPDNFRNEQHHAYYVRGTGWDDVPAGNRLRYVCEWGNL